jgi:hypothetical protein
MNSRLILFSFILFPLHAAIAQEAEKPKEEKEVEAGTHGYLGVQVGPGFQIANAVPSNNLYDNTGNVTTKVSGLNLQFSLEVPVQAKW